MIKNTHNPDNMKIIGGRLCKVTEEGRIRKNWKNPYRQYSKKFLRNNCKICGRKEDLTIHHVIPLSKQIIISKENCVTLCHRCHNVAEFVTKVKKGNGEKVINFSDIKEDIKKIIKSEPKVL